MAEEINLTKCEGFDAFDNTINKVLKKTANSFLIELFEVDKRLKKASEIKPENES